MEQKTLGQCGTVLSTMQSLYRFEQQKRGSALVVKIRNVDLWIGTYNPIKQT